MLVAMPPEISLVRVIMMCYAVPMARLGALLARSWHGLQNDVDCRIGLVMLVALASKNAILVVEFAEQSRESGSNLLWKRPWKPPLF